MQYQVWASGELGWVDEDGRWPSLRTLVRVQTSTQAAVPVVTQRYYLSSRPLTAAQADGHVRGHWGVENVLHWQLDVTFGEDDHQLRHHQAAQSLTLVRKMALNLLKLDPTKRSIIFQAPSAERQSVADAIAASSPVSWQHINLHGEFDLSDEALKDSLRFDLEALYAFNWEQAPGASD